jgi:hypothetical protein
MDETGVVDEKKFLEEYYQENTERGCGQVNLKLRLRLNAAKE